MDVFYEESAINASAKKQEKQYKFVNFGAVLFLALAVACIFLLLWTPLDLLFFWAINAIFFLSCWLVLLSIKKRINVSYDYTFVSGELRITKVFNVNKRKKVDAITCDEILQIGDADNPSFDRLRSAPNTKLIVCTSNPEAASGKFFMYILVAGTENKYLYLLECRELLLMNILKFARRSVLESDYVMQEKKQKKV